MNASQPGTAAMTSVFMAFQELTVEHTACLCQ